jgi:spore coat polysaccharide biosynthesis protein SpsF
MGSTRLPGKVLADIAGTPMIVRIVDRLAAAKLLDDIVIATTTGDDDSKLVRFIEDNMACKTFRGSADNVLDRYFQCARLHAAEVIVRITADDPFKDPAIIDRAIELRLTSPASDYCSNTIRPTFPEGLDVEVFTYSALAKSHAAAVLASEMEHVTPYIYKHPERFSIRDFQFERDLGDWRWTIDRTEDLAFANAVYSHFQDQPLVSYIDVIQWLDLNPHIRELNSNVIRREGYLKSLRSD